MRGVHWSRDPSVFLSCLCSCLLWPMVPGNDKSTSLPETTTRTFPQGTSPFSVSHTSPRTTYSLNVTPSTDNNTKKQDDLTHSVTTISTPVTSADSGNAAASEQETAPSSSISTQQRAASSQNRLTESMEPNKEPQTSIATGLSTSAPSSSLSGNIVTSRGTQETAQLGESTTSPYSGVSHTYLTTSDRMTAPPSTYTAVGETEAMSQSVTTASTPVTSATSETAEGDESTTVSSFRTSTQDTSASSQNHLTESTETSKEAQTTMVTGVRTTAPTSSPRGNIVTAHVTQETSHSGETTTSRHPTVRDTHLTSSEKMTAPPSTYSSAGEREDMSLSVTTTFPPVTSADSENTVVNEQGTTPSSSISTQHTAASSQNNHIESTEPTKEAQTSIVTGVSTSAPSSSLSGNIVTTVVTHETSYSGETTSSSHSSVGHTYLTTSGMMTTPPSTYTAVGETEAMSQSVTTASTPVTSATSETAEGDESTTVSSFRTSTQDTSASSQNHLTESTETSKEAQTTMVTGVRTTAPTSSPRGNIVTAHVTQETSHSGETTTSRHPTVRDTHLTSSEKMTAPPSTYSSAGEREDMSLSVTTTFPPVTSADSENTVVNEQGTTPSSSISTQHTAASSQNNHIESTEPTKEAQTSIVTGVSTSAPSSSLSGNIVTTVVTHETSYSGETTSSSHSSVGHTYLTTSGMMTTPPSTYTAVGETEAMSQSVTTASTPVTSATSETAEGDESTTVSSFRTSTQDTSASSQNHLTESTETSKEAQTTMVTGVRTTAPTSSPRGNIVTAHVTQETSHSGETTTSRHPTVRDTHLTSSEKMTAPPSTYSSAGEREDMSLSVTTTFPPVTSADSENTVVNEQGTTPSSSISTQHTAASSQNNHIESTEPTKEAQTSIVTGVSTSAPSSSLSGNIVTTVVTHETSYSGETTSSSHSSVGHTYLTTSGMMTTPPSTYTAVGETEAMSQSVTTASTPVIAATSETSEGNGNTTVSAFSTSNQDTSASSRNHLTESTEPNKEPETSIFTGVSTSAPSSSLSGIIVTSRGTHETSYSGEATTSSHSSIGHTYLTTSTTASTPVTSATSETTEGDESTTVSSFRTSTQDTSASSQNHLTESTETSKEPETTMVTGVRTTAPTSSPRGNIVTARVTQETSHSGETTTLRHPTVRDTHLTTSEKMTAPPSTYSSAGEREDMSLSVTTTFPPVTSADSENTVVNEQGTTPSSSISTQHTAASSQNNHIESTEPTKEAQTSIVTGVSTSAPSSSLSGNIVTTVVTHETSYSGETTSSSHSSVGHTYLTTSGMMTTPPSTYTAVGETEVMSQSVTTASTPVIAATSETSEGNGNTTVSAFSTSNQDTSASSRNHLTESTEPNKETETSIFTGVSTSAPSSSPRGNIVTSHVTQETSHSGEATTSSHSTVRGTVLTLSELTTAPTSTLSILGKTEDMSLSVATTFTPVTSAHSVNSELTKPATAPSSSISAQHTATSSQNRLTESMKPNKEPQTSIVTGLSTSAPSSSLSGNIVTSRGTQETAQLGESTTSPYSGVSHTYLTTSDRMTAPPSTYTAVGETEAMSQSVTTASTPVIAATSETSEGNGNTTVSAFSTSNQDTLASSQNHLTESTEPNKEAQTSIVTGVSTLAPSSSLSGIIVTSRGTHETSYSGEATTSSHSSIGHTYLTTSGMMTAPPSTYSTVGKIEDMSLSVTTTSTLVISTVSETTEGDGHTAASSFSTSPQDTSASSQNYLTKISKKAEINMVTGVSRTAPSASGIGNNVTSHVTDETSYSALGPAVTWNSTTIYAGHPTLLSSINTFSPSTVPSSSTVKTETSGAITTSLRTDSERSTATSLPSTTSQTLITSTPSTSTSTRSTATPVPINPEKGVSLFPFGPRVRDQEFVRRKVDFTSPLFKPQIGFPFGSSLRDFLYFTDNGQIIFPESEYQIFSHPNPPLRGFTDKDQLAIVAPFWDDADFSSHQGTIFYQEYETLYDDYKPLVVQQVESWIEKFTNIWNYKAKWTLKVTWVNAPAYPAQWTYGTSTYQAILSTDGSRSFTLFLYQSGGMQWDVTQHPDNWVLMGFSSGDGHYKNSPLTFRPAWEKYRPDQFLNSNSGLKGLQVYKLHSKERPNYRLRCLQQLKRQPQLPSLGWDHISCPCSWQQGLWDLRFQPIHIGWWSLGSRQLCSFSSWRGGVCCSYGPWGELLQGWRVQSLWQLEQELELQDWCCRRTDHSSFCALYHQRQPHISCAWYQPPRPAWMFGDPHITTLDGANYTFNGLGDFLLVRARDGNSSFLLQGRTAQTNSAQATNFIAFAAQYNTSSLAPITIQWLLEPNDTIHVWLNNQTVTFEDGEDQEIFNTTGVVMNRNGSLVSASLDGTVIVSVIALSNILHASCSLPEEYRNHTEGLLGVWNDYPGDDFKTPSGTVIPQGSTEEELFHYGMTWEINGTNLLGKRDNHLPSNFTPAFLYQLLKNNSLTSECKGDTQCIYDTLATGNMGTGLHTRMLLRRYQEMNNTLNQYPPSIDGFQELKAYMGSTTLIHYQSSSKDVIFTLRNNNTDDFKLFENGTLLWTPSLLKPFTLEILARNVKDNLSSVLQPKTVVCACKKKKQCLYNQTRWVGKSSLEVASCKCDNDNFGHYCERSKDLCDEQCFPNVKCIPGQGCEACPSNLTGDGRHCAYLQYYELCQNTSCPVNYCYNQGHCYISQTLGCQPTCTCPPAFTDARCFLAGNNFTPTLKSEFPLRTIQIFLSEEENASVEQVNASVAYRLENLDVRAFVRNNEVQKIGPPVLLTSEKSLQQWRVISKFQYRPRGPVIDFLNTRLLDAVVEAFLLQAPHRRWKRSEGLRNNVVFNTISRRDVHSLMALNVSTLRSYLKCNGYKGYKLVYSPQGGFTCMSPCSEGYCEHGGQCQHLPDGPHCSCVPFSIYMPWGEHCEHLSMKLGAFFGILFGALGALLLLGVIVFVVLHFWRSGIRYSYPLDSES
ncbi:mucin-4 isoform X2 [Desmodus rotundus]|uniref:mucin-4 isoform X2 n=1 Tax=Desmodus rotundus TaxID=9430 RepID=UPI0023812773|nr:mucin-4 isoform X2 [Desmodus rotundus]